MISGFRPTRICAHHPDFDFKSGWFHPDFGRSEQIRVEIRVEIRVGDPDFDPDFHPDLQQKPPIKLFRACKENGENT